MRQIVESETVDYHCHPTEFKKTCFLITRTDDTHITCQQKTLESPSRPFAPIETPFSVKLRGPTKKQQV
jgi:hypothetical protein